MGLGLETRWVWDCNPKKTGITTEMGVGLDPRKAQDCNPDGSRIATQVDLGEQLRWVWDRSPRESGIGTQKGPGLQPRWVWDCNLNGSGITTGMGLGRPWCCRRSCRSCCLANSLISPNAISRTGCSAGTHRAPAGCCGSLLPDPSARVYLKLLQLPSHYMHQVGRSLPCTVGRGPGGCGMGVMHPSCPPPAPCPG